MPQDQVFISYSRKDKKWREELEKHLKPFLRNGIISGWSDQQIEPGSNWFAEVQSALTDSRIAVLLVSPDFLDSDFIHEHELGPLLKKAEQDGTMILWIPVRSSAYKQTPLKNYQWFLRLPDAESFRWQEVNYFETLQCTRPAPFGVESGDDYHNADLAASVVVGPWQLAFGPIPVDDNQEDSFHERWIERFAQAAVGKLRLPRQFPLRTE